MKSRWAYEERELRCYRTGRCPLTLARYTYQIQCKVDLRRSSFSVTEASPCERPQAINHWILQEENRFVPQPDGPGTVYAHFQGT